MKKLSAILAVALVLVMVLAMLPMNAAAAENYIEYTVDSLGLPSQSYTANTATVGGVAVEWIQLGNYGDGIQVRDKNGNTSKFWNTAAFPGGITKIELVYSDSKDVTHSNPDCVIFNFGNSAKGADYSTKLSTTAGEKTYTITPNANTYTYFYMEHDLGYTMYWKSIKVYYSEAVQETTAPATTAPATTAPETTAAAGTTGATAGTQAPDATGDNSGIISMTVVMALAVTALAVLVIGNKKRMF